jgi:hypothetical protein
MGVLITEHAQESYCFYQKMQDAFPGPFYADGFSRTLLKAWLPNKES